MENHILGTPDLRRRKNTLFIFSIVNVQLVTTLKINCKAHGNGKGKGILDNLPLELTLNVMFFSTPKSLQN